MSALWLLPAFGSCWLMNLSHRLSTLIAVGGLICVTGEVFCIISYRICQALSYLSTARMHSIVMMTFAFLITRVNQIYLHIVTYQGQPSLQVTTLIP